MEEYIDSMVKEARQYAGLVVDTVYIGGGTPSLLSCTLFSRMFEGIFSEIYISHGAEISIEVNPDSLTKQKAKLYRAMGVNRLSMGLQSAQPRLLEILGRRHTVSQFLGAVDCAYSSEITELSADMMYDLPTQTIEDVIETASLLSRLPLTHISAYALKLEPTVPLYGCIQPQEYDFLDVIEGELKSFHRYEISNFSIPGHECRHNLKYWQLEDYVGLGAAAHSCYKGMRFANTPILKDYIQGIKNKAPIQVLRESVDTVRERLMLMTRLSSGIDESEIPPSALNILVSQGLATVKENRFILTKRGMDLQSSIVIFLWESCG